MDTWELISLPLSAIVVLLHLYGIYMLWRVGVLGSSKYVLIASFSLSNILFAMHNLVRFPVHRHFPEVFVYLSVVVEGLRLPFYGNMVLLTLERFLEVYLHMLYYESFFNKRKFYLALFLWLLFLGWVFGSVTALYMHVALEKIVYVVSIPFSLVAHSIIIVQFVLVYAYVYVKMRRQNRLVLLFRNEGSSASRRKIFIPFFIVLTFIFFDTVPDLFIIFAGKEYSSWILLLFRLDTLFNAVIYLFLQPRVKRRLSKRFRESKIIRKQMQDLSMTFSQSTKISNRQNDVPQPDEALKEMCTSTKRY